MNRVLDRLALLACGLAAAGLCAAMLRLLGERTVWAMWIFTLLWDVEWLRNWLRRRREKRATALRRLHRVLRRVRDQAARRG